MTPKEAHKIIRSLMLKLIENNPGKFDDDELADEVIKIAAVNPTIRLALEMENQITWQEDNR